MSLENLPLPIQDTPQAGGPGQITVTPNLILTSGLLDTAQAIQITSAPRFAGLTIGTLGGLAWLSSGAISALTLGDSLMLLSGILNVRTGGSITINGLLDTVQPIGTDDTPTFAALTIQSLTLGTGPNATSGILASIAGDVAPVELGQSLIFSTGFNRLDTVQALSTTAYPTFRGLTIGNTSGLALLTAGVVSTVTLGANLSITDGIISASSSGAVSLGPSLMYNIADQIDTRQPIRTSDAPTFAGLTLTGASGFLYANGAIGTVTTGVTLTVANNLINTIQDIRTSASPVFAGLTIGTLGGLLWGTSGVVSAVAIGSNLILDGTLDVNSTLTLDGLNLGTGPSVFQGILAAVDGLVSPVTLSGLTFNSVFNTLSTVQDIRTTASPTFAALTIGTLGGLLRSVAGVVSAVTPGANLTLSGTLDTVQNIQTSSSPTFAGLTLGTGPGVFQGLLAAVDGVCMAQAPGSSLTLTAGVLNTIQDIRQTAALTFASLTIGALSLGGYSGILYASNGVVDAATVGANLDISTGTLNLAANITVSGATIGASSGFARLAAGVVQVVSLGGNLTYNGVLDLADNIAVDTLQVGTLSGILAANSGTVATVTLGAGLSYAAGTLTTAASQTLSSLTLGSSSGVLCRVSGVVQNTTLDTNLSFSAGTLSIAASPVFTNLTLSIADGLIGGTNGLLTHVAIGSNLSLSAGTLNLAAGPAVTSLTIGTLGGLLCGTSGAVSAVTLDPNLTLQGGQLSIAANPTLAGLTLGTGPSVFQGILAAVDGLVSPVTLSGLTFNSVFNTLSTVQDIRTTASPTFAALTIESLTLGTISGILCRVSGVVQNATFSTNLTFSAGQLSMAASPTFTGLTLGSLTGILCATSGTTAAATLGANLTFSAGQLSIAADPTFTGLTLGSLTGLLYAAAGVVSAASLGTNLTFTSGVLRISSSPVFTSLTLGSSTALLYRDAGLIADVTLGTNLSLTAGQLSITASPTFTSLTLGTASGFLYATSGVVSAVTLGPNLTLDGVLDVAPVPVLAGLTLGSGPAAFDGILGAIGGHVAVVNFSGLTFSTVYNMLSTAQDIRSTASPTFAALTLSGLANGVLKSSSGVISGGATTDDLPEGSTNLYYTTTRARSAITAGTGISVAAGVITNTAPATITSITGTTNQIIVTGSGTLTISTPQDIQTTSSVTFARLLNSSVGTSNILIGTDSGSRLTTGGGNTLVGQGAGNNITSGTFNIGLGANAFGGSGAMTTSTAGNIAIGVNSLFSCTGTAAHNISFGYLALQSLTTGSGNIAAGNSCANNLLTGNNNVYIGQAIQASTTSVSSEGAINLTGSSITGKGTNTFFINASAGLYHYSAAYCSLVSTSFTSGPLAQWAFFNDGTTTYNQGFTLHNTNTLIVQPFAGLYEFTITANMLNTANYCQVSYVVTNNGTHNLAFSSPAVASYLGCVTGCTQYRPFVSATPTSTGIGVYINGGDHYGPYPARMTIRFVGL